MPSVDPATASGAARPAKQPTKVRHSITLSSMSKALADVINNKDTGKASGEKATRKSKEVGSRHGRLSAMGTARASIDVLPARRESPDMKTITRQTRSTTKALAVTSSSEDGLAKVAELTSEISLTRTTSLKPKLNSSALPKLRPNSVEPGMKGQSITPPLVGDRRKASPQPKQVKEGPSSSSSDSPSRPPSPRLKRTVKGHARSASENPPQTLRKDPPAKTKTSSIMGPPPAKPKAAPATISAGTIIPRPPSSASISGSLRAPSTPTRKRTLAGITSATPNGLPASPARGPVTRTGKSSTATASSGSTSSPNTPTQTEGDSCDSMDVEFMLGESVSPTAPTPALPRIRAPRENNQQIPPTTPTRPSGFLPTRSNLSYLSPLPPSGDSPPSLRPKSKNPGYDRGSLLSWEQLAAHDVDVDHMLSEIPAPFRSGAVSPSPSLSTVFDIPDSPSISSSGLSSPAGYQSISRVLLPDVTPSPAVHRNNNFDKSASPNTNDGAMATLLRLQLASAEHMAKERLEQMQSLEEQLHAAKQARMAEAEELANQVAGLESQLRCSLQAREKTDDERMAYTASLENQLRQIVSSRKQDVEAAVAKAKAQTAKAYDSAFMSAQGRWHVAAVGQETSNSWKTVRSMTEGQLELVRSNRECLSVLLSSLDNSLQTLREQASF